MKCDEFLVNLLISLLMVKNNNRIVKALHSTDIKLIIKATFSVSPNENCENIILVENNMVSIVFDERVHFN